MDICTFDAQYIRVFITDYIGQISALFLYPKHDLFCKGGAVEQYISSLSEQEKEDILSTSEPEPETSSVVKETKAEKNP